MNNWEEMGHVWDHTFRERLRIDPKECHILLTGAARAHAFARTPALTHAGAPQTRR